MSIPQEAEIPVQGGIDADRRPPRKPETLLKPRTGLADHSSLGRKDRHTVRRGNLQPGNYSSRVRFNSNLYTSPPATNGLPTEDAFYRRHRSVVISLRRSVQTLAQESTTQFWSLLTERGKFSHAGHNPCSHVFLS